MDIKIGGTYWMERNDASMKRQTNRRHTSIKKQEVPILVVVESIFAGTDKVGDYLRVRYTACGRGTTNEVKTYLTGKPVLNFIFKDALG